MRRAIVIPTLWIAAGVFAATGLRDAAAQKSDSTTRTHTATGLEFVSLPAGSFHYGCEPNDSDCSDDERPGKTVQVAAMWLGKTEVTVDAYAKCVAAGSCTKPATGGACNWTVAGREHHPINCVDWTQADAFCKFVGGRLPTAEEWEYASKGGTSRIYPWGNEEVTDKRANFADEQYKKKYPRAFDVPGQDDGWVETAPVGTYPAGASKQGLLDMIGNVVEWTSSEYASGEMEARGGSWASDTVSRRLRSSYRTGRPRSYAHPTYGFRCLLSKSP